ncbi:hypothetical protein FACS1894198_2460 [Clostridia bacterium]|nr:hypothetical protein FACS1894198_2460 [Clostridia bacterium]
MSNQEMFEAANLKNPDKVVKYKIREEQKNAFNETFDKNLKQSLKNYKEDRKKDKLQLYLDENGRLKIYLTMTTDAHWGYYPTILTLAGETKAIDYSSLKHNKKKDWVYPADNPSLLSDNRNKMLIPYVNLNSKDAEKVNKEVAKHAAQIYSDDTSLYYDCYVNNNILSLKVYSVSIRKKLDGWLSTRTESFHKIAPEFLDWEVYNFNLNLI